MYNNFLLKIYRKTEKIAGYKWSVENPRMVICLIHGLAEYVNSHQPSPFQFPMMLTAI